MLLQRREDFTVFGEAIELMFGEEKVAVGVHIENAAAALDERGFVTRRILDLGRQTGGPGEVVSLPAVLDGDFHRDLLVKGRGSLASGGAPIHRNLLFCAPESIGGPARIEP